MIARSSGEENPYSGHTDEFDPPSIQIELAITGIGSRRGDYGMLGPTLPRRNSLRPQQVLSDAIAPTRHVGYIRALVTAAVVLIVQAPAIAQDVPFLESPESVVEAMLELAQVRDTDSVYDLGSGDGRIVIAAAASYGARGVGIELESDLVEQSRENAREAGVEDLVRFVQKDFFEADFSEATVVMMYLQPKVNKKLRPILAEQLAPGTRIVSHRYEIREWNPIKRVKVEGRSIFLYVIP
jgi:SAM-dependent methyltransferase